MDIQSSQLNSKTSLEDFFLLTVIGKGAYAKVILVKSKHNGIIYALKIIKKSKIEKQKQIDHIYNELNILVSIEHPFIVKLQKTFQNEAKLFFVLEYCPGGELFNLLQKSKRFNENQTLFYTAQIVLALNHLHEKDIVYRDLKPENVLIDLQGYIKLTDFGLSKIGVKNNREANSVCGTPEYLAPEVLMRTGHGKQVDWWTLGCILFEMIAGIPPFYCSNRQELFEKIKYGSVNYPKYVSPTLRSLLEGLFIKDPEKRFNYCKTLIISEQVRCHPWFQNMNWEALLSKQIIPPFLPSLENNEDANNFDPEFLDLPITSLSEQDSQTSKFMYTNFSYNRDMEK